MNILAFASAILLYCVVLGGLYLLLDGTSDMASFKKGVLTQPPQWWKHLRDWKRIFWKKERKAAHS
jgi:hypothetical protein